MKRHNGFTILELALAMAFISFLLLAIGIVTIQVSRIYQKGITIKLVNSNGRELVDEFSRTILASRYSKLEDSNGTHFEYTYTGQAYGQVDGSDKDVPFFGAFCTGGYSYIWNTGYTIKLPDTDEGNSHKARLIKDDDTELYAPGSFRLLRINDASHEVCINYAKDNKLNDRDNSNDEHENTFRVAEDPTNPVELLATTENDADSGLVLYDLSFYEPAFDPGTGDALFSASFILGTTSGKVDITTAGDYCKNSEDIFSADSTYCSINKFNFAARATGGITI
ncbi:prepilin-type N-terminal cleavage/methylation domain-containing protein [Candidatus Saccharibacteria bacterium]|nr:prepilin-type N-terminal cleavage/methylation domain-containing protein [Candidatus Saccharibacteria bacterium]MBQ3467927.1 prepilin-type N-terminal cleavage/methylation domain-containing protein [Candidatus Saccharibacteria bacterium]